MAERLFGGRSPHHRDTGEPSARPRSISVKRERALDPSRAPARGDTSQQPQ
jgi:hypothetical protein